MATPPTIVHLEEVTSTQDEARQRFSGSPTLVTASRQTRGRGRSGSGWESADRAIAASLAWEPGWPEETWSRIPAVAGLAALDAIGSHAALKWPNDVLVEDRKVAGILVESSHGLVVAGIGINVWWPDPMEGAGGLHAVDPGPDEGLRLAEVWADRLLARLESDPAVWGRDEYQARSMLIGEEVTWEPDGLGRAVGIAADAGLIVETAAGRVVLDSGAVRAVRHR